jgi:hypothetical protein
MGKKHFTEEPTLIGSLSKEVASDIEEWRQRYNIIALPNDGRIPG